MRAQIRAKAGDSSGVQAGHRFLRGQEHGFVTIFGAALGDGVEKAHRVQLVAEKFYAQRLVIGRGERIKNAAAQRKLPHALHQAGAGIACGDELFCQLLERIAAARHQTDCAGVERRARDCTELERFERGHQHRNLAAGEIVEHADAALLPLAGDAGGIKKRQLTARQHDRLRAGKRGKLRAQAGSRHIVLTDGDNRALGILTERGNPMRAGDLADAGDCRRPPGLHQLAELLIFRTGMQKRKQDVHG